MRTFIIELLRTLLRKLEVPSPRMSRVRELVLWAETEFPGFRGERLHHQVINKLRDEFPDARARDLCFEVELVLQELK